MGNAPVVGRFAPTPSGRLHLGNLFCALLAYLSARKAGGRFLLRIEDIDLPRCPARLARQAIEDLRWLGLDWDGEPLYQSRRTEIYERHLALLAQKGLVYPCFCTRAQLHASAAPNLGDTQYVYSGACARLTREEAERLALARRAALRLRVPDEDVRFTDGLYGPQAENLARDCGDFILRRSDGLFSYQLAVVVDDALSGVTQVVRGRDILSATPRQIYLLRTLGYPVPEYVHIPLLMDHQGRRLAKRDHDLSLTALSKRFTSRQLVGMLAFSAGLLPEPRPASPGELIEIFDWAKVPTQDARLPQALFDGLPQG
ncbi:MAG: tRNA glutamyl-Q(34) synthetase GluQRS [Clostridiales bacterium]|nr:tRNA glutamyl-Q(34) synthetase GluQRS [Clostridiales bacterium]MDO4350542.1 tRNA glutamyl-Q(34) synthetase GluQRS [Eubacteriales bacterium]